MSSPTSPLNILSIPRGILTDILASLNYRDIIAFSRVSKACRQFFLDNDHLKLVVQCVRSGVAEVLCDASLWPPGLVCRYLKMRDNLWTQYVVTNIKPAIGKDSQPNIPVSYWHLFRHEEGILISGNQSTRRHPNDVLKHMMERACRSVEFLEIAEIDDDEDMDDQEWRMINVHEDIVELGFAIRESDLIVVLTILPLYDLWPR